MSAAAGLINSPRRRRRRTSADGIMRKFDPDEVFLTTREAAAVLHVAPRTLANWRSGNGRAKQGPPFVKVGGRILYAQSELLAWLAREEEWKPSDANPRKARSPRKAKALTGDTGVETPPSDGPPEAGQTPADTIAIDPPENITVAPPPLFDADLQAAVSAILVAIVNVKRLWRMPSR